jgi:hypothetical protein
MKRPATDEEFLAQFPPGSVEREYHAALLPAVRSVEFPRTERAAFALFWVLIYEQFVVNGVDLTTHPAAGSRYENAELVAHVFSSLGYDSSEWAAIFPSMSLEASDEALIRMWREALGQHGSRPRPGGRRGE